MPRLLLAISFAFLTFTDEEYSGKAGQAGRAGEAGR